MSPAKILAYCADESGSNAIEYAIIACVLCITLVTVFGNFTGIVAAQFSNLSNHIATGK